MDNRCQSRTGYDWYSRTGIQCHRTATITLDGLHLCVDCAERHALRIAEVQKVLDYLTRKGPRVDESIQNLLNRAEESKP